MTALGHTLFSHRYTPSAVLASIKHPSLSSLELENLPKKKGFVQNIHLPNNCVKSVLIWILTFHVEFRMRETPPLLIRGALVCMKPYGDSASVNLA